MNSYWLWLPKDKPLARNGSVPEGMIFTHAPTEKEIRMNIAAWQIIEVRHE